MAGEGAVPPGVSAGTNSAGEATVAAASVEKPKADPWKVEAQPIREDQVVNAVNFLAHPKVRGSPIVHRRTFLERKGLTGDEIDEAFRRVPDPSTAELAAIASSNNAQARTLSSQPVAPGQESGQLLVAQKPSELSWGQKLLGLGAIVVAGAGAGVLTKVYLLPMFKSWVRSIMLEESETDKKISPSTSGLSVEPPVTEATLAAAASEVAAAMREFSHARAREHLQLGSIIKALETQTHELKTALSGMRDIVTNSSTNNSTNNSNTSFSEFTPTTISRGRYRQDPWRTPEMPRPSGMLTDRTYAGAVLAPAPAEKPDTAENGADQVASN